MKYALLALLLSWSVRSGRNILQYTDFLRRALSFATQGRRFGMTRAYEAVVARVLYEHLYVFVLLSELLLVRTVRGSFLSSNPEFVHHKNPNSHFF